MRAGAGFCLMPFLDLAHRFVASRHQMLPGRRLSTRLAKDHPYLRTTILCTRLPEETLLPSSSSSSVCPTQALRIKDGSNAA